MIFFFSLFLSLSQPILAWKEATTVFSNFLNFFAFFFNFLLRSARTTSERFFFFSFSASPNQFWLEKNLWQCFLIFWIFLLFFWNFCYRSGRNTSERFLIYFILFYFLSFSAFRNIFWLENKLWWCFLNFWIFLQCFFNFLLRSARTPPKRFFFFSPSRPLPTNFGLKRHYDGVFLFFEFFCYFFRIFITGRVGTHRNDFFLLFSLSWPFPTYFGLKRGYDGVF